MSTTLEKPQGVSLFPVPNTAANIYTPKRPFPAKLISKRRICHSTSPNFLWHLVLSLEGSEMVGRYRVGQSIGVVPEGRFCDPKLNHAHSGIDGKIRLYSIASACWGDDWHGRTVSLCLKREFDEDESGQFVFGCASNYLCDVKPGDTLMITGPVGKSFLLPDNPLDYNYVFVATGTGIAPFRGMVTELLNQGFRNHVWLVFGVPYSTDIMYDDEFQFFARKHPNFRYVTAISREQRNVRGSKLYVQDRLEENGGELVPLLEKPETLVYMCGLKGMEYGIYQWLYRVGSKMVAVPEGLSVEAIQKLPRDAPEWIQIEKSRDRNRLFKETY